jgi:hypothetical protein
MKLLLSSLCQQNIPHLPVLRPRHRRHVLLYIDSSSSGPSIYATLLCLCRVAWKKPNDFGYGTKFSGLFHFTTCMLMNFITVNNSSLQYWHVVTFRYALFRFITLRYKSKPFAKKSQPFITWHDAAFMHFNIPAFDSNTCSNNTCIHAYIHAYIQRNKHTHTSIPPRWKQWKGCAPQNACQNRAKQTHTHTKKPITHIAEVSTSTHIYIHAHMHTYTQTYLLRYVHTYTQTEIRTYMRT